MQQLWQLTVKWDGEIPKEFEDRWRQFYEGLDLINGLKCARNVQLRNASRFADASQRAFGACIYIVTINEDGDHISNLLCAKYRVAPLKQQTLPRLELNAAVLLVRLMNVAVEALDSRVIEKRYCISYCSYCFSLDCNTV